MTILVTAANGELGKLVIDSLLARGAHPSDIVAGARTPAKATSISEKGIRVVPLDYDDPATITAALEGVDRVLLISGSEVGKRTAQHQAVIDAATTAGVSLLVYTSVAKADLSSLPLAPEHLATEQAIAASGLPAVILRNNWYAENYLAELQQVSETGVLLSATGDARVSLASRVDFAEAAAAVLIGDEHIGQVYELAGEPHSYDEIADAFSAVLGKDVAHRALPADEFAAVLQSAGLDEGMAGFVTALNTGIAAGDLDVTDSTLVRLIGRPVMPLVDVISRAVSA